MKRRSFLKGLLGAAGASVLPKSVLAKLPENDGIAGDDGRSISMYYDGAKVFEIEDSADLRAANGNDFVFAVQEKIEYRPDIERHQAVFTKGRFSYSEIIDNADIETVARCRKRAHAEIRKRHV